MFNWPLNILNVFFILIDVQASNIQRNSLASLQTIIGMTSDKTIDKLLKLLGFLLGMAPKKSLQSWSDTRMARQTVLDAAMSSKHVERLGLDGTEEEDAEVLNYHCRLLTGHLSTTWELKHFFHGFPWRAAAALLEKNVPTILGEMKQEWEFVLACTDKLMNTKAQRLFQHTLYQPYRDLMTKAEYLD